MSETKQTTESVRLTEAERDAVWANGSWPHIGPDLFAEVERIVADRLREALHAAWLAVHIRRFDGDYEGEEPPEYARHVVPDTIYNGTRLAEKAIGDVAARYGIDYHALRAAYPPVMPALDDSAREPESDGREGGAA